VHGAIEVFVNGLAGVFGGMAMLYVAIRLISAFAARLPAQPAKED
jgi:Na+-transporting methylmalonyl-CoA/oxaloacetate decarboxylase gamma subunit